MVVFKLPHSNQMINSLLELINYYLYHVSLVKENHHLEKVDHQEEEVEVEEDFVVEEQVDDLLAEDQLAEEVGHQGELVVLLEVLVSEEEEEVVRWILRMMTGGGVYYMISNSLSTLLCRATK
jgi:hypothetical protein